MTETTGVGIIQSLENCQTTFLTAFASWVSDGTTGWFFHFPNSANAIINENSNFGLFFAAASARALLSMSDDRPSERAKRNAKLPLVAGVDKHELLVFVHTIQLVEDGKWIVRRIRSVVGLESFDKAPRLTGCDALYFSVVTGNFSWFRRSAHADREFKQRLIVQSVSFARESHAKWLSTDRRSWQIPPVRTANLGGTCRLACSKN